MSSISRLPLVFAHFNGKQHEYICKLHAKYGPITRTAPDELTITTSRGWRDIYQTRPGLIKDPYTRTPPPNGADQLFTAEGETHKRLRRLFAGAFSDKAIREMGPVMDSHASRLNLRLARDAFKDSRGRLDILKYYGYTTLDIMGELAFGDSFHSLDPDSEHERVQRFFLGTKFGSIRSSLSRYYPLDFIFGWVFLRFNSKIRQKNFKTSRDMITRRLDLGKLGPGKCDLIDPIIGRVNEDPKNGVTRNEVEVVINSMLLAGCPLSTVVITAATYFLLRYPETLSQLTQEIRSKFYSEQDILVRSTDQLPYLEAVIMETLRIHHPTPSDPKPRAVGPGGQFVDDHWLPAGVSRLHVNPQDKSEPIRLVRLHANFVFARRPSLGSRCKQPTTPPPTSRTRMSITPSAGSLRRIRDTILVS